MTDATPNLALPFIMPQQAQKHVTHNEALNALDALVQPAAASRTLAAPPDDPAPGARYIVAAPAAGAWSGREDRLAHFVDGAWAFHEPGPGWLAYVDDEQALLRYRPGEGWTAAVETARAPRFGVNTDADATNRLAVKSDAVLLSHDDVTPGSGDIRAVLNRQAQAGTASLVFQTGWSGRAEMGTAGSDDFVVKVSADGVTWREALTVEAGTGRIAFPSGGVREKLTAPRSYHVAPAGDDANDGRTPATPFATLQKAVDVVYGTLDLGGFDITIQLASGAYAGFEVLDPQVGAGRIVLRGDTDTPDNCTIRDNPGSSAVIDVQNAGTKIALEGLHVTRTTTTNLVRALAGARIELATRNKMSGAGRTHTIMASVNAYVEVKGTLVVADQCYTLLMASRNGYLTIEGASIDLTASPNVGIFALASIGGIVFAYANTFNGAALGGYRHVVQTNAIVHTNGGGASYFPNDNAGTTQSGGVFA
ncbi:DUF2793 domain-containing protein [Pseudohoeflea suaedae]|nr:DUF2793 domain-containing protein [Pseudohoeflea suaedae]